jgi:hypothetical protein
MGSYDKIADLPVSIDSYSLELLEHEVSAGWTRCTSIIRIAGGGEEGRGEDVNYSEGDQRRFQEEGTAFPPAGQWSIADLSAHLDTVGIGPEEPEFPGSRDYRRWAFESAALDLALQQVGTTLAAALEREAQPLRFVVSMDMSDGSNLERLRRIHREHPGLGFKLDAGDAWNDVLIAELAALGTVAVVDLKGMYEGTPVDTVADADLYARVAEGLPDALIEDPRLTEETRRALDPHMHRVTWDAPIHSVADIQALDTEPRVINIKPSRFGPLRRLFDAYDYCDEHGITMYGGGQFELGLGRGHIQYLASLFHPSGPNDIAPAVYNTAADTSDLPDSPLAPALSATGFRWGE